MESFYSEPEFAGVAERVNAALTGLREAGTPKSFTVQGGAIGALAVIRYSDDPDMLPQVFGMRSDPDKSVPLRGDFLVEEVVTAWAIEADDRPQPRPPVPAQGLLAVRDSITEVVRGIVIPDHHQLIAAGKIMDLLGDKPVRV